MASKLEKSLTEKMTEAGYLVRKLGGTSIDPTGWPDRMILIGNSTVVFAEIKEPGDRLSEKQIARISNLDARGYKTFLIESEADITKAIETIQRALSIRRT